MGGENKKTKMSCNPLLEAMAFEGWTFWEYGARIAKFLIYYEWNRNACNPLGDEKRKKKRKMTCNPFVEASLFEDQKRIWDSILL